MGHYQDEMIRSFCTEETSKEIESRHVCSLSLEESSQSSLETKRGELCPGFLHQNTMKVLFSKLKSKSTRRIKRSSKLKTKHSKIILFP